MKLWKNGTLEKWKFGKIEIWKYGTLEKWNFEKVELWKYGNLEKWKFEIYEYVCLCSTHITSEQICACF